MKKTVLLLFLFTVLHSYHLNAQNLQEALKAKTIEKLDIACESNLGYISTPIEIKNLIKDIVLTAGIDTNSFELKSCTNINNVIAKTIIEDNKAKRYLIIDGEWMEDLLNSAEWIGKFNLAHEIGHHLNAHDLNNLNLAVEHELEADYFAGRAIGLLGGEGKVIESALSNVPKNENSFYPSRKDRIISALRGWESKYRNSEPTSIKKKNKLKDLIIYN